MYNLPDKLVVRRKFRQGTDTLEVGTVLTADVFLGWRNLRSMLNVRYLVPLDEEYGKGEARKREEAKAQAKEEPPVKEPARRGRKPKTKE